MLYLLAHHKLLGHFSSFRKTLAILFLLLSAPAEVRIGVISTVIHNCSSYSRSWTHTLLHRHEVTSLRARCLLMGPSSQPHHTLGKSITHLIH